MKKYFQEFPYNFKLAWPVIVGMLGHTLVGIVDNIIVGKLGPTELAAVSLANSFIFIGLSFGIGFSTAITPIVAESHSQNDIYKGRLAFQNGLLLCTVLGMGLFAFTYFAKPLLTLMGQDEEVVNLAKPFLDIVGFSLIPLVIFQGYKQFADGLSETKYSMYATLFGNIVNVVLNFLLVYGWCGFPKYGIIGSAIATLIARVLMVVFIHFSLFNRIKFKSYFNNFGILSFERSMTKFIIKKGIPSSLQMFFEVALFTAAIWLSGRISIASQAANQIALSLASMTFMFANGLGIAALIRVANQKGLQDFKKLNTVAHSLFLMVILLEFVFAFIFYNARDWIPLLFVNSEMSSQVENIRLVVSVASQLLWVAAIFQIFDGIQVVVLGALRGLQDVKIPTLITFIAYWIIGFPISAYLGLKTSLQAEGIWIGLLAGLTAAAVLLYFRFIYLVRKY